MKALIAMSGGVDSSVAAWMLVQEGYDCLGATMRLVTNVLLGEGQESSCCSLEDVEDARAVAYRLGMPFYVFNFTEDFEGQVVAPFVRCYEAGLTPNPCIECNRHLKFDRFLRRGLELGCDAIATGHYARIARDSATGRYLLLRAVHPEKDQSYVLYMLTQKQLAHIRFPLGTLKKDEVRQIAREQGFVNARKRDSQDICFIPDGDYPAFLERYTGRCWPQGAFLNLDGAVVGQHQGAVRYTLGQRKGLGLAMGTPVYVCGKDMEKNTVTVGPETSLYSRTLWAENWNWFPFPALTQPLSVTAKTRYSQREAAATVYPEEDGCARVEFLTPQRAVTPGQAVVLYDGDTVLGGGTITKTAP